MKKLFFALVMSTALVSTSCETEATVDAATIQQIVDAAIAAALISARDLPTTNLPKDSAS